MARKARNRRSEKRGAYWKKKVSEREERLAEQLDQKLGLATNQEATINFQSYQEADKDLLMKLRGEHQEQVRKEREMLRGTYEGGVYREWRTAEEIRRDNDHHSHVKVIVVRKKKVK